MQVLELVKVFPPIIAIKVENNYHQSFIPKIDL